MNPRAWIVTKHGMTGDLYEALAWDNGGKPLGVSITTPTPLYEGEGLRAKLTKLDDLLAVIHRDGGHYQAEHGTAKAIEDAIAEVHALIAANGDLQSHFDALAYDFRRWKEATKEVLRGIGDGLELVRWLRIEKMAQEIFYNIPATLREPKE